MLALLTFITACKWITVKCLPLSKKLSVVLADTKAGIQHSLIGWLLTGQQLWYWYWSLRIKQAEAGFKNY